MSDVIVIAVEPAQPLDVVVSYTCYTVEITTLYAMPDGDGALTVIAANASGVQAVYSGADMSRWPAWVSGMVPTRR